MYLTRLTLFDHPDLNAILRRLGNAYYEHKMLWDVFESDPEAERDFLYRRDTYRGRPRYFILSRRPPVHSLGLWHIDSPKPFTPRLQTGQRLTFMLRANPVVTRNGKRHDVVMDRKKHTGWKDLPPEQRPPLAVLIREAGLDWLRKRAEESGFHFHDDAVQVDGYRQHRARSHGKNIRFSTLDFTGLLTVSDPDCFVKKLKEGIGPAKAFGCGLMLVRRA